MVGVTCEDGIELLKPEVVNNGQVLLVVYETVVYENVSQYSLLAVYLHLQFLLERVE